MRKRMKRNELVNQSKIAVEPVFENEIYLGIYHLQSNPDMIKKNLVRPLVRLKLSNFGNQLREIKFEARLVGIATSPVDSVSLSPGESTEVSITPTLDSSFNINSVENEMPAQLALKITAESNDPNVKSLAYEKTYPIKVLPRDWLPLSQRLDADTLTPRPEFIASWVTVNAKAVEDFLGEAKKYVKYGFPGQGATEKNMADGIFAGNQAGTFAQVRGLWDALKAKGVSYVMDPDVLSDFGYIQRTRLPADVLRTTNAQCLEGTILFATLLRSIGLEPILVRVPGHAFVGWRVVPKDIEDATWNKYIDPANQVAYVETTMISNATFEQAVQVATGRVIAERKAKNFDNGIYGSSFMLDLTRLYQIGFRPAAYQRN